MPVFAMGLLCAPSPSGFWAVSSKYIYPLRNRLQMIGIHAPRIAAKMVKDVAIRNSPLRHFKRDAVG